MGLQTYSLLAAFFAIALAQVPPPEIKPEWVKAVDLSNVPNISPKLESTGTSPGTTSGPQDCEKCWESCGNCARDEDIYGCTANKWALTFDDGPSDKTAELLDILGASNVKATFLMLGSNVIKYPAVVKRAYEAGHQIASHTWSHPRLMSLSNEQIIAEVKSTEEAIFNITGPF
ncbi:chitin deacetylase [Basidiobolus ranarum]|uniref:Chitin deacetylase n=1 Tax=Basidiobolus ranarum TaxID=34480 RepID=A0ABR2WCD8_9FUNG